MIGRRLKEMLSYSWSVLHITTSTKLERKCFSISPVSLKWWKYKIISQSLVLEHYHDPEGLLRPRFAFCLSSPSLLPWLFHCDNLFQAERELEQTEGLVIDPRYNADDNENEEVKEGEDVHMEDAGALNWFFKAFFLFIQHLAFTTSISMSKAMKT